jgi:hypothetical protein
MKESGVGVPVGTHQPVVYFRHLKLYRTHFATGGFKYNYFFAYVLFLLVCLVVFNATFSNMSVISW